MLEYEPIFEKQSIEVYTTIKSDGVNKFNGIYARFLRQHQSAKVVFRLINT
jgi:hypothetical protein